MKIYKFYFLPNATVIKNMICHMQQYKVAKKKQKKTLKHGHEQLKKKHISLSFDRSDQSQPAAISAVVLFNKYLKKINLINVVSKKVA